MKKQTLNWVREHFSVTPHEQLVKNWKAIETMSLGGPKASEYIQYLKHFYLCPYSRQKNYRGVNYVRS